MKKKNAIVVSYGWPLYDAAMGAALLRGLRGNVEIPVDVRLITATNRNLPQLVAEGKFRADLFQRLCVLQIEVPPLRAHKEDIPDIVHAWYNHRQKPNAKYVEHPSDEQIAALMDYDYPGNVRELMHLPPSSKPEGKGEMDAAPPHDASEVTSDKLEYAVQMHVRRVYEKCGRNLTRAAAAHDVSRNTVRKHLEHSSLLMEVDHEEQP